MGISISNATSSAITKYSESLRSGEPDWSMIPSAKKSNRHRLSLLMRLRNWLGKPLILQVRQNWKIFIDREPRYVQNICPMYHRTERHYINKQKMQ